MMDVKSFPVPIIVSVVKCVYQHCMVSQQPRTQRYSLGPGKIATLEGPQYYKQTLSARC